MVLYFVCKDRLYLKGQVFRQVRLCVAGWAVAGILKGRSGFIFRTLQFQKSGMIDPGDEGTTILRHSGNYLPSDTSPTPVFLISSAQMWKLEISYRRGFCVANHQTVTVSLKKNFSELTY